MTTHNLEGSWLKRSHFRKALKSARSVESIPNGCYFSFHPAFEDGEFVICPMKSGRKALIQIFRNTPSDPGDQHFYSHKVIGYLEGMER